MKSHSSSNSSDGLCLLWPFQLPFPLFKRVPLSLWPGSRDLRIVDHGCRPSDCNSLLIPSKLIFAGEVTGSLFTVNRYYNDAWHFSQHLGLGSWVSNQGAHNLEMWHCIQPVKHFAQNRRTAKILGELAEIADSLLGLSSCGQFNITKYLRKNNGFKHCLYKYWTKPFYSMSLVKIPRSNTESLKTRKRREKL